MQKKKFFFKKNVFFAFLCEKKTKKHGKNAEKNARVAGDIRKQPSRSRRNFTFIDQAVALAGVENTTHGVRKRRKKVLQSCEHFPPKLVEPVKGHTGT
eukprot:GEMP01095721.1.p2 GENE.GEMP01095721.1~~GEMP01095721.1.p2  ORF type:complete len:105 (-),score=23.66 GEMP01095721.1:545-838(-)